MTTHIRPYGAFTNAYVMVHRLQIPILGITMPKMGISTTTSLRKPSATPKATSTPSRAKRKPASARSPTPAATYGIASALFSLTQQRVLGLLFGQPNRSFFASEIIALASAGSGATQRELARLETSGLVTTSRVGNQKHYHANAASPIFHELVGIIVKTVGIVEPLSEGLLPLTKKIDVAFVYGSIAKGSDTAGSDIDVMILADSLSYAGVYEALAVVETRLGRSVSPTVQSLAEWKKKRAAKNAFTVKVQAQPKLFLIGSEADLA